MASTTDSTVAQIKVTTSDGATLSVARPTAERSILIKNLLEDLGGDNDEAIPIPNVRIIWLLCICTFADR